MLSADAAPCDRGAPLTRAECWAYFLAAALLDAVGGAGALRSVAAGGLVNPDSYMRLVRLRDILASGMPLHDVARDASGAGALLPWSHFLDSLILLLALPFRLALGWPAALHVAASLLGPLSVGALGLTLAWAVAPLANRAWLWTVPVIAALTPVVIGYGAPGVAHHHVLACVVVAAAAGWAVRVSLGDERAGPRLGAWAAAGIWLTPETMPFSLAAFGAIGLGWVIDPGSVRYGRAFRRASLCFLLLVGAALAVDPPFAGYGAAEIDRLSIVYVGLGVALCLLGGALRLLELFSPPPPGRAGLAAVAAGLSLGGWLVLFPTVIRGPDGLMSAAEAQAFLGPILEMQPIASISDATIFLLSGLLAVATACWRAVRDRSILWAYAGAMSVLAVGLGAWHLRFAIYAEAAGAALAPLALAGLTVWLAAGPPLVPALARVALLALLLLGPRAAELAQFRNQMDAPYPDCRLARIGAMLAPYAGRTVLANVNASPELLYRTRVLTVGSLYHRGIPAFLRLRAAWRSQPSDGEPAEMRATGAALVLFCPSPRRSRLVADLPPETLQDRLGRGQVPPWLERIAYDAPSGQTLYRIVPVIDAGTVDGMDRNQPRPGSR